MDYLKVLALLVLMVGLKVADAHPALALFIVIPAAVVMCKKDSGRPADD